MTTAKDIRRYIKALKARRADHLYHSHSQNSTAAIHKQLAAINKKQLAEAKQQLKELKARRKARA